MPQLQKYENLINKACWGTLKKWEGSGLDFDELKSQAYLVFCEAVDRFDTNHGVKFSTFLTWRLRTLNDYAAYNSRRVAYIPDEITHEEEGLMAESTDFQAFCERLELRDASSSLGSDARELLSRLLAGEFHKVNMGHKKTSKASVTLGMRSVGWNPGRVEEAWKELQGWWKYF